MQWLNEVFTMPVKKYPSDNQLPESCFLMDNVSAHRPALVYDMNAQYEFIKVKFFPQTGHWFCSP